MKHKIAYMGLFIALAIICSYIETLIPFDFGIPGMKLGLTNIVIIWTLYLIGVKEAYLVSILRILLVGFLFGNAFSIIYSLAGGLLSLTIMCMLMHFKVLHIMSISIAGGITHNIGQLLIASIIIENVNIFYYAPILMITGVITGMLIGIVSQELILRIKKINI